MVPPGTSVKLLPGNSSKKVGRWGTYDIAPVTYEATDTSGTLITGHLDVTKAEDWGQTLEYFASRTGGALDVLDNNTGIIDGPWHEAGIGGVISSLPLTAPVSPSAHAQPMNPSGAPRVLAG